MKKKRALGGEESVLNKGIEVMLPRSRRVNKPSWFDVTFRFLKRTVRVRIDIHQEKTDGN